MFKTSAGAYGVCLLLIGIGVVSMIVTLSSLFEPQRLAAFVGWDVLLPLVFLAIGLGLLWSFRRDNVGGHQSSCNSYELNLVCHDAQRLNVTDHGALWPLRETALKLDCC